MCNVGTKKCLQTSTKNLKGMSNQCSSAIYLHQNRRKNEAIYDGYRFCDDKTVLLDFMKRRTTITAATYCETLTNMRGTKLSPFSTTNLATITDAEIHDFRWELLDHPPYSPDLAL